jgi:hypothetical protein
VATPQGFLSFVVIANPAGSDTQTSVMAISRIEPGDTRPTARTQTYLHRYHPMPKSHPPQRGASKLARKAHR